MRKKTMKVVLAMWVVLVLLLLVAFGNSLVMDAGKPVATPTATSVDAPGAWIPSPVGSGWCVSKGIPGLKDGTRRQCPRP